MQDHAYLVELLAGLLYLPAAAMDAALGGVELASIATVWLAFAAPAWYRRWVERLASAATSASRA